MKLRHGHRAADARHDQPLDGRRDARPHAPFHEDIVNLGVAMVPEGRRLFPKLTVEENLLLGAFRPLARGEIAKNSAYCYEIFPVLAERRRQLAGSMSGGQQQMLAIAPRAHVRAQAAAGRRALRRPRADPGVDTITKIKELKERYGLTVLMAEQNFHQAIRIADRGYIIVHGEIVFEGGVKGARTERAGAQLLPGNRMKALCFLTFVLSMTANAQDYPARAVRMLVGYPPGGGMDTMARIGRAQAVRSARPAVRVENRPGASGGVAAEALVKSTADGHVLMVAESGTLALPAGIPR